MMTTQHVETLIIGAGQAGLATGYHLSQMRRSFLIVDRNSRIGDNWRAHYDSLRLYTAAKHSGLPGMEFPADDKWHFPGKNEVADFLETYALTWDLPVRMSTAVHQLSARDSGGFTAELDSDTITCDNVVIATGTFGRTPRVPDFADQLDPGIKQMHSSQYKRPSQLQDGPVLVVGASHSGTDIAYETAQTRETILCGRDCGQIPFRWGTSVFKIGLPVMIFMWKHVLTRRTPMGRKEMVEVRNHGGPMTRIKREDLAARGVRRLTARVGGFQDGKPVLDDGTVLYVGNVIWATGFKQIYDWIDLPVIGDDGWPVEYRGVVDAVPGLYFCGLSFQFAFSSMLLPGIGRDAEYIARRIAARERSLQHA